MGGDGVQADSLREFIARHRRLLVLTGAGCSTDSGIPDYRDVDGQWKRPQPVNFQDFMAQPATRQRYWARSLLGWPRFGSARPNATHHALAALEAQGSVQLLLTQNVDRLHQAAGSRQVIDLHGRLDRVRCMGCQARTDRADFQQRLLDANPGWERMQAGIAPDGDADLAAVALREAEEESGLPGLSLESPAIFDLDRHWIPARGEVAGHWHYDVRYIVHAGADETFVVSEESHALAWVSIADVAGDATYDASLRRMARKWGKRRDS